MKHFALWLGILSNIMFLNSENAIAETLLKGQVTLRDKSGEPVNNAQISAIVGKANPVSTNSDGVFTLEFLDKNTGQKIKMTCAKSGFDVVNWYDLEPRLPDNPDASDALLQVVMCPKEGVSPSSCAVAYISRYLGYNFDANFQNDQQKIQQEYEEKLQQLEASARDKANLAEMQQELLNAKNAQIAELEKKYETLLAQKEEWAKQFAEYDQATATDEMYKEALRLFQENKLDDAIAVLDDAKIQADLQRAQTQAANRYRLKAQSYVAKFDFANAETYYQKAIDADPKNIKNINEFASYLEEQNSYLKAIFLCEKALLVVKNDLDLARILNNLGVLYEEMNQFYAGEVVYQRALSIYEELAIANPQTYEADIVGVLNNLGILYRLQKRFCESIAILQRALKISENSKTEDTQIYQRYLAMTLNNLGNLYSDIAYYDDAIEAFQKAITVYEKLTISGSNYQSDIAGGLNNLGILYENLNLPEEAVSVYERALSIRVALASKNPQAYELDIGQTFFNLSNLYEILYEQNPQTKYKMKGLDFVERAIGILQKYPDLPRVQDYLEIANARKAFFEQAGE